MTTTLSSDVSSPEAATDGRTRYAQLLGDAAPQETSIYELDLEKLPSRERPSLVRFPGTGYHRVGAFSVQNFIDPMSGLSKTHDDVRGFLRWMGGTPDFWFKDGDVRTWAFREKSNNVLDTFGADACLVTYLSSHGGTDDKGVYGACPGFTLDGSDDSIKSDEMAMGAKYCRYVFWSTCNSLRVLEGCNPVKTWDRANRGLRMIFGFESTSADDGGYGQKFGEGRDEGFDFGTAWLLAGWDIGDWHVTSVAACADKPKAALNLVHNEWYFERVRSGSGHWAWRWLIQAPAEEPPLRIPAAPKSVALGQITTSSAASAATGATGATAADAPEWVVSIVERFDFPLDKLEYDEDAKRYKIDDQEGAGSLYIHESGRVTVHPRPDEAQPSGTLKDARERADEYLDQHGLTGDYELAYDKSGLLLEDDAPADLNAQPAGQRQTAVMVQYRQRIGGVPVITPARGTFQVMVGDGLVVTSLRYRFVKLGSIGSETEPEPAPQHQAAPSVDGDSHAASAMVEQALAGAYGNLVRRLAVAGGVPTGAPSVVGTQIGYDVQDRRAVLVAQRVVEVEFGNRMKKRYRITARI